MAKNIGLIGNFSGKVGNVVGYTLKNSNNKVTMATRAYVAEVANPQTEAQAIQRMKLAPANNFYRQLIQVLNNAWQGQKYGTKSRQYFMKLALMQTTGIPFIVKGDKSFYPGEYPVSEGSIPVKVSCSFEENLLVTDLACGGDANFGEFSQDIINTNFGIINGDKITFIAVYKDSQNGTYLPIYSYIILDTTSQEDTQAVMSASHLTDFSRPTLAVKFSNIGSNLSLVGAACIVSRLSFLEATPKWLRSNATLKLTASEKAILCGASAYNNALISYMNAGEITSPWYLNEGITGNYLDGSTSGGNNSNVSVVSVANTEITIGQHENETIAIATMSDGTKRAYRSIGSTSYVVFEIRGEFFTYGDIEADSSVLETIVAAVPEVTGWLAVLATEDSRPVRP